MMFQGVQSNHGKGKIVLEVTYPGLTQHEGDFKRSEVVSLQCSYPVSERNARILFLRCFCYLIPVDAIVCISYSLVSSDHCVLAYLGYLND